MFIVVASVATAVTQQAIRDGLEYICVDTYCINKTSSAELSEAINSMFAWYRQSSVCYVFLEDYTHRSRSNLAKSRWFTRGWTLQELIAPFDVRFYDSSWVMFGDRLQLSSTIGNITSIDHRVLSFTLTPQALCTNGTGHPMPVLLGGAPCNICRETTSTLLFQSYSVSTKMSWAAGRETTRVEDIAYCMMGIFGVNMPLLYGEGGKAFRRLQEEIVRRSNDQTILAWRREIFAGEDLLQSSRSSIFASHPAQFRSGNSFDPIRAQISEHSINHSSAGIEMDVYLVPCRFYSPDADIRSPNLGSQAGEAWLAVLNCSYKNDIFSSPALLLEKLESHHKFYRRCFEHPFSRCQYVIISEGRKSCEFLVGTLENRMLIILFFPFSVPG
jgi:hypothetical protein